jgi:hypothetical protein
MEFPFSLAESKINDVIAANWKIFAPYREMDREDLGQICMMRVLKAWPSFDATKAAAGTFIYQVSLCALRDEYRTRRRRPVLESCENLAQACGEAEEAAMPGGNGGNVETIEDWLSQVYEAAKLAFPRPPRFTQGRRGYGLAKAVAVYYLRRRRPGTSRKFEAMFQNNRDLRKSLRLRRPPSHMWFYRAFRLGSALMRQQRANLRHPVADDAVHPAGGQRDEWMAFS